MYYVKTNQQTLVAKSENLDSIANTLRNIKPFSELHSNNLEFLLDSGRIYKYKKHDLICSASNLNNKIYFIIDGSAISYRYNTDGNRIIYFTFNKNDFIYLENMFKDIDEKLSVQSVAPTVIISWPKDIIITKMKNDTSFSWEMNKIFSKRVDQLSDQVELLKIKTVIYKLSRYLLEELNRVCVDKESVPYIKLDFNNIIIASYLGVSREIISRVFTNLKKEKIIRIKNKIIYVENIQKLKNLAQQIKCL